MHKPFGFLTTFLFPGITLFVACSNGAVTPAPETLVSRATKTLILEATPTGSSRDVVSDAPPNPEYFGGYNTNLRWLFKTRNDVVPSPAISNGVVYIGSDHGHVCALE
jgi:outer membrane protein assembly factor BamB